MKLTQKTIAALDLPKGKTETIFFDEGLSGFGLRMRSGGSQVWIFQYKLGDKHRRVTIGSAAAIKPEQARATAANLHALVRLGRDPAGEKIEGRARAGETFENALQSYLLHQRGRLKPRSYAEVERHLLVHAKPLHGLQLAKIERRTIASRVGEIAHESGSVTSNRVRASLQAFFAWAIREGLIEANPVIGTGRHEEASRDRILSDDEIRTVWNALLDDQYGAIIKLLIFTGQRASEIARLSWSEIFDGQIVLPAERTKNGRLHCVPLSSPAQSILESQTKRSGRDFVFGYGQGPFSGWSKSKQALDDRIAASGQMRSWTVHDLRRSCATGMAELGIAPHVVEAVLNHISGHKAGVAGIYNRSTYETDKRKALVLWGDHVLAVVEGDTRKIVPLRG